MTLDRFDLLMVMFAVAASVAALWWLRGTRTTGGHGTRDADHRQQLARRALADLQDLASRVAADIDRHTARVREISDPLSKSSRGGQVHEADAVFSAAERLIEANDQIRGQLEAVQEEIRQQAHQTDSRGALAHTDAATGLANRHVLDEELARRLAEFSRDGQSFAVMLVDVDFPHRPSDECAQTAPDNALRGVAELLNRNIRQTDMVARFGPKQFAAILLATSAFDGTRAATRLRRAVSSAPIRVDGQTLGVALSQGLAEARSGDDAAALLGRADEALHAAISDGQIGVFWHDGHTIRSAPESDGLTDQAPGTDRRRASDSDPRLDALAALPDAAAFRKYVDRHFAECQDNSPEAAILLVRVDHLPQIVDIHGEQAGQLVLGAATLFLQATIRRIGHLARHGWDTFALLLPETKLAEATHLAEGTRAAVARFPLSLTDREIHFTITSGLAELTADEDSAAPLKHAEAALEAALAADCNCVYHYDTECHEPVELDAVALS